jgi:hypothetical protein
MRVEGGRLNTMARRLRGHSGRGAPVDGDVARGDVQPRAISRRSVDLPQPGGRRRRRTRRR